MKIHLLFAWYDFWIGWYYDRKDSLYICPLPMFVVKITRELKYQPGEYDKDIDKVCGRDSGRFLVPPRE